MNAAAGALFDLTDPTTGDGLTVKLDGTGRLFLAGTVCGTVRTVVIVDGRRVARELAAALLGAVEADAQQPLGDRT